MSEPARKNAPVLTWRPTTARHRGEWPEGYWKTAIWRGLKLRCPVCGRGKLFATYFRMKDQCECCGVGFAREHGQWVGSLDINTLLTAIILMAGAGFGPLWPLATSLTVWCTAAVVFPILTFRLSRGLWTAIVYLTGGVY